MTQILSSVNYPQNLPVTHEIANIKALVKNHPVVIVCGETGSGKTTQLPKMLYEMGYSLTAKIGHTQPRKVAAKSIARRIGEELNNHDIVGYKVRFNDRTKTTTAIKLMTDGILLQEIQTDKLLKQYSALIIDEAHERSLNIDFILGYLKNILPKRPDLKVIITSATIDNDKLSKFFNNAPVVNVEGKTYPVDIIYQPLNADEEETLDLNQAIFRAIESCLNIERGNVLVFLPGEREIKDCISSLRKTTLRNCQLLPFFSRQNELEQNLVFNDDGNLKVIVTTNVAETSLTIPGIKYVIDSGVARVKRYNSRYKVEQLQIEKIAKSSCKQRAGRAGRLSHGLCVRLYSESDFNTRDLFSDPEILRSNLANVILRLLSFRLGNPQTFPFLDKPDEKSFNDGFKTLFQLQAINEKNEITDIGKKISLIPVDVNLARILFSSIHEFNTVDDIVVIVSFLAISDPREYPLEQQEKARQAHQIWVDKKSDFITVLNLWRWYQNELQHKKSRKKMLEDMHKHFVSALRMREWHELHGQLKEVIHNLGTIRETDSKDGKSGVLPQNFNIDDYKYKELHQTILTGLINNVGQKDLVENVYLGTNSKKFYIHPSSAVDKAKWVCSANLTQTTKLYARINAQILPEYLLPITKHLVKYTYSEERWEKNRGEAVATQFTLLYGLLINRKSVAFSKINPVLAREIFIKQGVVNNELGKKYNFVIHNEKVINQIEKLEDKIRSAFIIFEDELFKFYNEVIPLDICDVRNFDLWLKQQNDNEDKLKLEQNKFMAAFTQVMDNIELYPDFILNGVDKIKLKYIFNPDNEDDGVSAFIDISQLNKIDIDVFDWLVPGLIRDKLSYIVKALPKQIRVGLNPVSTFITNFLETADMSVNLYNQLANYINKLLKSDIKTEQLTNIKLPKHLNMHFKILDNNKTIYSCEDLRKAYIDLADKLHKIVSNMSSNLEIMNITKWEVELANLLEEVNLQINHKSVMGYKALSVKDGQINLIVVDNLNKAISSSKNGMFHLVKLHFAKEIKYLQQKQFNSFKQVCMYFCEIYDKETFLNEAINYILKMSIDLSILPKTEDEFHELIKSSLAKLSTSVHDFNKTILAIALAYNQIKLKLKTHPLHDAISTQLDDLIFTGFLKFVGYRYLEHFPRYLNAILYRMDKYQNNPNRDMLLEKEVTQVYDYWYNYIEQMEATHKPVSNEVYNFKYKIEELRVSLFAEVLKTPYPVSSKRLVREFDELTQMTY